MTCLFHICFDYEGIFFKRDEKLENTSTKFEKKLQKYS